MALQFDRKIARSATFAAALLIAFHGSAALAQSVEAQLIHSEVRQLASENPGSAIVYASCEAVAEDAYRSSKDLGNSLGALAACGAAGCAFTESYKNCLEVDTELFLLHLRLESL